MKTKNLSTSKLNQSPNQKIRNIALIFGGVSGEHEVSLVSASFVAKNILSNGFDVTYLYIDKTGIWHRLEEIPENADQYKKNPVSFHFNNASFSDSRNTQIIPDFYFPMIHGTSGEDGTLQGFFELINKPYAGNGVYTSSVCMDKYFFHQIMERNHIEQVPYIKLENYEWNNDARELIKKVPFGFPWFIKPANLGSSVGVHKIKEEKDIPKMIEDAFFYDNRIVIEYGYNVREIEFSILGNAPDYQITEPAEIIPNHEFYSYEAKYKDDNGASLVIPAKIESKLKDAMHETAIRAFASVGGEGFARIDFFLQKDSGKFYLNEINTIPGFTPISMFPRLWQISGLEAKDLIKKIISLGYQRWQKKSGLKTDYTG